MCDEVSSRPLKKQCIDADYFCQRDTFRLDTIDFDLKFIVGNHKFYENIAKITYIKGR